MITTVPPRFAVPVLFGFLLCACAKKRDGVYGARVGRYRSSMAMVTVHLGDNLKDVALRAGKSKKSGQRALWIQNACSGDFFIDTR